MQQTTQNVNDEKAEKDGVSRRRFLRTSYYGTSGGCYSNGNAIRYIHEQTIALRSQWYFLNGQLLLHK
jgi:hypothetical protein